MRLNVWVGQNNFELIYMLTVFESTLYTTKNEITLFTDGREKFDALIEDIKQAEDHIHFQYYQ
ncbi:hypothetical protein EfmAA610_21580 [Enterococcus faecium]|nr:hypothetical protein EfmAA610_21580 [Enterococcus faecium]